jgi:hypothetical protein
MRSPGPFWLGLALVAGCGASSGAPDAAAPPLPVPDAGAFVYRTCDLANKVGEFRIELDLELSFTAVSGAVLAAVVPKDVPAVGATEGGCRVLHSRNLFCNPPCAQEMTCGDQGQCVQDPKGRSAGTVSISGLAAPVTMMPSQIGQHYDYTKLPHPGFQPGAEIVLQATGGDVGPFLLQGRGVAPVVLTTDKPVLEAGKPFELRWQPGPAGPARIAFRIEIDQHGQSQGSLQCDVPDQGMATVGAGLIDELIKLGTSGFPKITVARRTVDATTVAPGCVELVVTNAVERPLAVPGHSPCRTDGDCPAGKTCALALETCR